jgi:hypothetical protein
MISLYDGQYLFCEDISSSGKYDTFVSYEVLMKNY